MLPKKKILALTLLTITTQPYAQGFQCSFIQEKFSGGKPNTASCSANPEVVYRTKFNQPKSSDHCDVEAVYSYTDLENVLINPDIKLVTWTEKYGLTEDAKIKQKAYYIRKGDTEESATKKVSHTRSDEESFEITSYVKSHSAIFWDAISRKSYEPYKKSPVHNFVIQGIYESYLLTIPEATMQATLIKSTGDEQNSWVNLRFGKCRFN